MFVISEDWLMKHYGSHSDAQYEQTRQWLLRYGTVINPIVIDTWAKYKHLAEYQVNTNDIIPRALSMIGDAFESELQAHREINLLRVPIASYYERALEIVKPCRIVELGVGGDSAISTSVFLAYLEINCMTPLLLSCDRNPLGVTKIRYEHVGFWHFIQTDSVEYLKSMKDQYDLIFIDTIHSYEHTLSELECASQRTDSILLDDATFEGNDFDKEKGGVKKAIQDWLKKNVWYKVDIGTENVCLLKRGFKPFIPEVK